MQKPMIIRTMITKIQRSKLLCWLWGRIYHKWLWNNYSNDYDVVICVMGWRTARIRTRKGGAVKLMSPCFWIFD